MPLRPGSTGRTASVDLDVSTHTVRDVRAVVLDLADAWDSGVSPVDLALLVDEVTTDVTDRLAPGTDLLLEVSLTDGALRVALTDPVGPAGSDPGSGLVRVLADRRGDDTTVAGRRRWFELEPPTPDAPEAGEPPSPADLRRSLELAVVAVRRAGTNTYGDPAVDRAS